MMGIDGKMITVKFGLSPNEFGNVKIEKIKPKTDPFDENDEFENFYNKLNNDYETEMNKKYDY